MLVKINVLFLALFCITTAWAQDLPMNLKMDSLTHRYSSVAVLNFDTTKKEMLYAKAREWVAFNYRSANAVVQLDDAINCKLIGKGIMLIPYSLGEAKIRHTIIVECKDGRVRINFTNLISIQNNDDVDMEDFVKQFPNLGRTALKKIDEEVTVSIKSFRKYIGTQLSQKDSW